MEGSHVGDGTCPVLGKTWERGGWYGPWAVWIGLAVAASAQPLCSNSLVRVFPERIDGRVDFYIENLQTVEVTATVEVMTVNMRSSSPVPHTRTMSGGEKVKAFTMWPVDTRQAWSYRYNSWATMGSPRVKHNDQARYRLPYEEGQAFRVIQGYHGKSSHQGESAYAIDWAMPIGTPVHAAREGVVAALEEASTVGGPDRKYEWCANFVMVRHPDGTLGNYVHLKEGGVTVQVGQFIKAGDLIGYSGNTGHSTGPHLHFEVFKGKSGKERETLPVKFLTDQGGDTTLERSVKYRHPPSGGD